MQFWSLIHADPSSISKANHDSILAVTQYKEQWMTPAKVKYVNALLLPSPSQNTLRGRSYLIAKPLDCTKAMYYKSIRLQLWRGWSCSMHVLLIMVPIQDGYLVWRAHVCLSLLISFEWICTESLHGRKANSQRVLILVNSSIMLCKEDYS